MLNLNEDLFDDIIEIEDLNNSGPITPEARGLSDVLLSLINDENNTIQSYNSFIATLEQFGTYDDFISVINDINAEEMNHIGMLQTLLKKLSPNAEHIKAGEEEAEDLLVDDEIKNDSFLSYYMPNDLTEARLEPYEGWKEEDIKLHKSIDWQARDYEEYECDDEEFDHKVIAYGYDKPMTKVVKMHKFIRSNPIYPPYYKAIEEPFENVIGPMYDGNRHGSYDIHDRYETQDLYDSMFD